jgi:PE-PPE domain/PE family
MSLNADFGEMEAAAQDLRAILANLSEGNAMAAPPTTGILPAGVDEVSAAITALFNTHGLAYQQLATAAEEFHQQFANLLSGARAAYEDTEITSGQMLRTAVDDMEQPFVPMLESARLINKPLTQTTAIPTNVNQLALVMGGTGNPVVSSTVLSNGATPATVSLLMGGTGGPTLPPAAVQGIAQLYGLPNPIAVTTPEQFWPLTPKMGNLTMDQSVAIGTRDLNSAITQQLSAGHNVIVWGTSQSSLVATHEIRNLIAAGSPDTQRLSFILTGDPCNPDGGILERFNGAHILGVTFSGATPPESPYTTAIYVNQYDPLGGDFPRYPLNLVSDLNAVAGLLYGQHYYGYPLSTYQVLPTSPGYTGHTTYYFALDQTLPLVAPLRIHGFTPLADLLQPDLRVISDMGYGTGEYPNIPTTASLIEHPDWPVIAHDLTLGVSQGINASLVDLNLLPRSDFPTGYPYAPVLDPNLNYPLPQGSWL